LAAVEQKVEEVTATPEEQVVDAEFEECCAWDEGQCGEDGEINVRDPYGDNWLCRFHAADVLLCGLDEGQRQELWRWYMPESCKNREQEEVAEETPPPQQLEVGQCWLEPHTAIPYFIRGIDRNGIGKLNPDSSFHYYPANLEKLITDGWTYFGKGN
jgi:hypothetical protein